MDIVDMAEKQHRKCKALQSTIKNLRAQAISLEILLDDELEELRDIDFEKFLTFKHSHLLANQAG